MNNQLLIKPHPDAERMTATELRQRFAEIEDQLQFGVLIGVTLLRLINAVRGNIYQALIG